ncbi:MAG: nucleotidyltransferase substrate binding protein [Bacteroidales bacterium]|nr:nucleotidyltransferase substrate binding protein [Bacteroidales bacterium]
MEENKDIRWQQRFSNFNKAFKQLHRFVMHQELNEMESQGLIKAFDYTYELGWKTLQDLLKEKGYINIIGPKPVIEQSYQNGYIKDGKGWMRMHKSRNLTSHTYDEETAAEIVGSIRNEYFILLQHLQIRLEEEMAGNQNTLFDA